MYEKLIIILKRIIIVNAIYSNNTFSKVELTHRIYSPHEFLHPFCCSRHWAAKYCSWDGPNCAQGTENFLQNSVCPNRFHSGCTKSRCWVPRCNDKTFVSL